MDKEKNREKELIEMMKEAAVLLAKIRTTLVEEMELETSVKFIQEHGHLILVELCGTAKTFEPNIHIHIDEILQTDRMKKEGIKVTVSSKTTGADLLLENGKGIETKTSRIKKATNSKCNFSWNIPPGGNKDRRILVENVKKKTQGGGARFRIENIVGKMIKEYTFTSAFLLAFFAEVPLTEKADSFNFGCRQCQRCESFHRLDKLVHLQTYFEKNGAILWTVWNEKEAKNCVK
jgi:hypothetical protein